MFGLFGTRMLIHEFERYTLAVGDKVFLLFFIGNYNHGHTLAFWKYKPCTCEQLEEFCLRQHTVYWITHKVIRPLGNTHYKVSVRHSLRYNSPTYSYFRLDPSDYSIFIEHACNHYQRLAIIRSVRETKLCWKKFGF